MKKNVVFVGFMGTGKTALAKKLAHITGMRYVSIDDLIVSSEGRPITDIFRDEGEPYFRRLEKDIVSDVMEKSGQVVDTGGGVVLDEDNMRVLKDGGVVLCLWADADTIYERTKKHGHRPLLNVPDPVARIKELLDARRPFYEKADIHINTDDRSVDDILEEVKDSLDARMEDAG
ncbi:MAG: shikimate kinase [Candidatus Omnitrophica bacterium]|nr:shikimate kinase [Candidatus Omnitrophota bacterium]MDD5487626.1 shikimate kinase [Candidatus Omnitrophota bacterium]